MNRHAVATHAGTQATPAPAPALAPFVDQKTVLLTSYRRDGTPVGTPVHIAVEGDHAYMRTYDRAWKIMRIRRNPAVEVVPSTLRGEPTGPAIHARARILSGEESKHAAGLLARKYRVLHGLLIPFLHRLRGYTTMQIELTPAAAEGAGRAPSPALAGEG